MIASTHLFKIWMIEATLILLHIWAVGNPFLITHIYILLSLQLKILFPTILYTFLTKLSPILKNAHLGLITRSTLPSGRNVIMAFGLGGSLPAGNSNRHSRMIEATT